MKASYLLLTFLFCSSLMGQKFLEPAMSFSHKKVSYFTLKDKTEITGTIKKIKRKKGLIKEIKIENEQGQKEILMPEDIQHMYLPKSGWQQFGDAMDFISDATQWDNETLEYKLINEGYIYFEQAEVKVKKKQMTLLMQLLNPSFSSRIRVYHDPFAQESMGLSVAGVNVVGRIDKSYYIAKVGETALRQKMKDYDEYFYQLFDNCPEVIKAWEENIRWVDLPDHIVDLREKCE